MLNVSAPTNLTIPSSTASSDDHSSSNSSNLSSSPRRLSQHITDIVTAASPTRSRSGSSPRSPSPTKLEAGANSLTIDFDGGAQIIVRPNRIVRGKIPSYLFFSVFIPY